MLLRTIFAAFVLGLAALPARAEEPARVMSINLCTDQYLLTLLPPERIVSVSSGSRSELVSYHAEAARALNLPINHRSTEEVVAQHPDLVFAGEWEQDTQRRLKQLGYRVESFPMARTVEEAANLLRRAGALLGETEKAERIAREIETAAARTRLAAPKTPVSAIFYYAGGYSYGGDTLFSDLLATAGMRNLPAEWGMTGEIHVDLERLVAARPDILLSDDRIARLAPRVETDALSHPALRRALPDTRRVAFPLRYWVCSGESTVAALDFLAKARDAAMR